MAAAPGSLGAVARQEFEGAQATFELLETTMFGRGIVVLKYTLKR